MSINFDASICYSVMLTIITFNKYGCLRNHILLSIGTYFELVITLQLLKRMFCIG